MSFIPCREFEIHTEHRVKIAMANVHLGLVRRVHHTDFALQPDSTSIDRQRSTLGGR